MIEHAVIEVGTEKKAYALKHLASRGQLAGAFCDIVHHFQVTVDDQEFFPVRNPKA